MKSLLQTKQWAALRQAQGWQAHWIDDILILEKSLPLGKSFLYSPEVSWENLDTKYKKIYEYTKKIAENHHTIFLRLEILDVNDDKITSKLKQKGFIKAFEEIQPEWRQIIDIARSEEEILAQMKPKGRYNIRVAQKHGIKIETGKNEEIIAIFYKLFCQTAERDGFEKRPKQYFVNLMQKLAPDGLAEILIAKYNNIPVAAEIVTFYDGVASYLYGASNNDYRNLMAPYLLHFEAIKRAKEKGCQVYDLLAVAPEGAERHKYAGITRFKEQFGGRKIHLVGSWDYVYKPGWYKIFKIAEKFRRK